MARLTIERAITNLFFKDDFQGLLLRESNLDSCCPLHALKQKNIVNLRCKGINTFSNQNLHQCFRFINFCIKATWYNLQHYHLEVQNNPPKNGTKKMLFLASMKKQDYPMAFLLISHLGLWNADPCWILRQMFLNVWLLTSQALFDKWFQSSDLFDFAIFLFALQ